jgi:hypothetical protein
VPIGRREDLGIIPTCFLSCKNAVEPLHALADMIGPARLVAALMQDNT